jgi:hypothetical protein
MHRFVFAASFETTEDVKQLQRRNFGYRPVADLRVNEIPEGPFGLLHRCWRKPLPLQLEPLGRNDRERVGLGILLHQPLDSGIDAIGDQAPSLIPFLSGAAQRHVGVLAEGQQPFPPVQAVFEPPEPRAGGRDLEV